MEMEQENLYGKLLFHSMPQKRRRIGIIIFSILAFLFFLFLSLVGIFGIVYRDEPTDLAGGIAWLVMSVPAMVWLIHIWVTKSFHPFGMDVFEHGVVISHPYKGYQFDFEELDGIAFLDGKMPEYIRYGAAMNTIPTPMLTFFPANRKAFSIQTRGLQEALLWLMGTYTNYVIGKLTPETINTTTIKFGKNILFQGGKFIHTKYRKEMPLNLVTGITGGPGKSALTGINGTFPLDDYQGMNLGVLIYLADGMKKQQGQ